MTDENRNEAPAEIVGPETVVSLEELCLTIDVEEDWVATLIEQGVIEPQGQRREEWRFTSVSLLRIAKARRLERDLSLNAPGIALALELLDEIDELRSRLEAIEWRRGRG